MKEKTTKHYSSEIRERAVRMVREHQSEYPSEWSAIQSISAKFGCTAETLRRWLRQTQPTISTAQETSGSEAERTKALEREVRELRQANEILRKGPRHILRRWSSTVGSSHESVHRRPSRWLWSRANLQSVADCPIDVLLACCTQSQSRATFGPRQARRGSEPAYSSHLG